MKIKRMVAAITMTVCLAAAAVCMTGCGTKYSVTLNNVSSGNSYTLSVGKGKAVTMDMIEKAYPEEFAGDSGFYRDQNLYTDDECLTKFVGGVYDDMTLYYKEYSPELYGKIIFDYNGEEYIVYRPLGDKLSAEDFTVSAYGRGEPSDYTFYSDSEHTQPLTIENTEVKKGDETLYVNVKIYVADVD